MTYPMNPDRHPLRLPISNPEHRWCTVLSYSYSLLRPIWIQVDYVKRYRAKGTFYIRFQNVQRFEGPIRWTGADLRIATREEFIKYWHTLGSRPNSSAKPPNDSTLESLDLYIIDQTSFGPVKILAGKQPMAYTGPLLGP